MALSNLEQPEHPKSAHEVEQPVVADHELRPERKDGEQVEDEVNVVSEGRESVLCDDHPHQELNLSSARKSAPWIEPPENSPQKRVNSRTSRAPTTSQTRAGVRARTSVTS
jgi:hypothetical protein